MSELKVLKGSHGAALQVQGQVSSQLRLWFPQVFLVYGHFALLLSLLANTKCKDHFALHFLSWRKDASAGHGSELLIFFQQLKNICIHYVQKLLVHDTYEFISEWKVYYTLGMLQQVKASLWERIYRVILSFECWKRINFSRRVAKIYVLVIF